MKKQPKYTVKEKFRGRFQNLPLKVVPDPVAKLPAAKSLAF